MIYSNSKRVESEKMSTEIITLKDRIIGYQDTIHSLRQSLKSTESTNKKQKATYEDAIAEKDAIIKELTNKIAHMASIADRNGTNAGISTASTPINQKKLIPNARRGSSKAKGGQQGHARHVMEGFDTSEITETEAHELDLSVERCDLCDGKLLDTGRTLSKDEFDVEINVVKRRHEYHIYECVSCGAQVRLQIDSKLKEANQYGDCIQAVALSLMVTGNVAINKVRMLITGMTAGQMNPSEGFICKLYKRAATNLEEFMKDLKSLMIQHTLLYWDDTVITIQAKRACMRFYGDESISYYTAHDSKDLDSILEDNVLALLTNETTVMHDHNKVNYNDRFCFGNIECNQHLERDLQKVADDNPSHVWAVKMKLQISLTIKERKDQVDAESTEFSVKYIAKFKEKMKRLIKKGYKESSISTNPTTVPSEKTLLKRIEEYFDNYFRWVEDFRLPTTDNLSERGLRSIKSHMKISGQFESEKTATYYAVVKTYVETCRKNCINEMEALSRLCAGNPFTVGEIFA